MVAVDVQFNIVAYATAERAGRIFNDFQICTCFGRQWSVAVSVWNLGKGHIESFAGRHAAAMSIAAHQSTGKVTVTDEQQAGHQFVAFAGGDGDFDRAKFAGQFYEVAVVQFKSLHIVAANHQSRRGLDVVVFEFAFADTAALLAGSTWYKNECFSHFSIISERGFR